MDVVGCTNYDQCVGLTEGYRGTAVADTILVVWKRGEKGIGALRQPSYPLLIGD